MEAKKAVMILERMLRWSKMTTGSARFRHTGESIVWALNRAGVGVPWADDNEQHARLVRYHAGLKTALDGFDLDPEMVYQGDLHMTGDIMHADEVRLGLHTAPAPLFSALLLLCWVARVRVLRCGGCGEMMVVPAGKKRYHNNACRQKAYRNRKSTG